MSLIFILKGRFYIKFHHGHLHLRMNLCKHTDTSENIFSGTCIALPSLIPLLNGIRNPVTISRNKRTFLVRDITVYQAPLFRQFFKKFLLLLKFFLCPAKFPYDDQTFFRPAKKRSSRTRGRLCIQSVLLQYTQSIIIQIKIPLLI